MSCIRLRQRVAVNMEGIVEAQDPWHAVESGADALVVSNHGGRQRDAAPSSIAVLAGGKAGVTRCLEILCKELDISMALCGHRDIRDVDERIFWHFATERAAAIAFELTGKTVSGGRTNASP